MVRVFGVVVRLSDIRDGATCVPYRPAGVIKARRGSRGIRRDPHPPALIQNQGRAQTGGVNDRRFLGSLGRRLGLGGVSEAGKGGWGCACRARLCTVARTNKAMVHQSFPRRTIPPEFLRALQFNSVGCTRQTETRFHDLIPPKDGIFPNGASDGWNPATDSSDRKCCRFRSHNGPYWRLMIKAKRNALAGASQYRTGKKGQADQRVRSRGEIMTAAFSSSKAPWVAAIAFAMVTTLSAQSTPQSTPASDPSAAPAQTAPQAPPAATKPADPPASTPSTQPAPGTTPVAGDTAAQPAGTSKDSNKDSAAKATADTPDCVPSDTEKKEKHNKKKDKDNPMPRGNATRTG